MQIQQIEFDRELDVSRLSYPRPLHSIKKSTEALHAGQILKVIADDQSSANDFQTFARHAGLVLLGWKERNGQFQFYIRKP